MHEPLSLLIRNAALGAVLGVGVQCSEPNHEGHASPIVGLEVSHAQVQYDLDIEKIARDPAILLRALSIPHQDIYAELGAHQLSGGSQVRLVDSKGIDVEKLSDVVSIDIDKLGNFYARLDNSASYGRHVSYIDGDLYLRPGYGDYHRRKARPGESESIRDEMFSSSRDYLEAIIGSVALSAGEATKVAGRDCREVRLSLKKGSDLEAASSKNESWRQRATVKSADGLYKVDSLTGIVLSAKLSATLTSDEDGKAFTMALEAEHEISSLDQNKLVAPPENAKVLRLEPAQDEVSERNSLLKGLAPTLIPGKSSASEVQP